MSDVVLCVETVESAPFAENSYVVWRRGETRALVIDPGFDLETIDAHLRENGLTAAAILNTHGHADHIVGNGPMKLRYPEAPLMIGRNDAALLADPVANLSDSYGMPLVSPPADRLLDHGETLNAAGIDLEVREIPGHSPGSVVFVVRGVDPPVVFGGDVLFAGSVGRSDFPGGDGRLLASGIRTHLYSLPDTTVIWPGHGPSTTVGEERRTNPFVQDQARRD